MASFHSWVRAARLRTLPLALASIAMGGAVASLYKGFNLMAVVMAAITTLFLQILSNFANDYGDFSSGIDNEKRVGPKRTVQSGEISPAEMKMAIVIFAALSLISGLYLIFVVSDLNSLLSLVFVLLGFGAIAAAIKYTVGKNPYGYVGLGDFFVFLFFGLIAVGGTFFLATQTWDNIILLPAAAMGLFSTGVLNLNNMRDVENDRRKNKITLAVKLGVRKALGYHFILILMPFVLLTLFLVLADVNNRAFLFLLLLPLFFLDLLKISKIKTGALLDPFLKRLALKTLFLTMIFGFIINT